MASPPPGVNANQWAQQHVATLRQGGQNPAAFGFNATQQEQDAWARQSSQYRPSQQPQGNYSAYGQAQPQQQSFGTPYNPQQGGNFSAYRPQQQQPTSTAQMPQWASQLPMGGQNMGIPAFQFSATDFMGNQYSNPAAFSTQQGAMTQALNQQRSAQINNMYTQGTPLSSLNPQMAYNQGMQMLQGGWQNPFADQTLNRVGQQAPPSQLNPAYQQLTDNDILRVNHQRGFGELPQLARTPDGWVMEDRGMFPDPAAPYNPRDHRAAYEQQQRTAALSQGREELVRNLGLKGQGDVSDAAILRAMFPSGVAHQNFRGGAADALARAGIISEQEAAQLNRESEFSGANDWLQKNLQAGSGGRIYGLPAGGWTISQGVTADMHARAAADRWNTEHGLVTLLPKRAEYMDFLVNQRGVPQAEARRLAEQQYPSKSYADEFRRLAAAKDHDQLSILQYGMTEAQRRQRQMADEAREQQFVLDQRKRYADERLIRAKNGDLEAQRQLQRESSAVRAAQEKLSLLNAAAERAKNNKWEKHSGPTKKQMKAASVALQQALANAAAGRG